MAEHRTALNLARPLVKIQSALIYGLVVYLGSSPTGKVGIKYKQNDDNAAFHLTRMLKSP